MAKWIRARCRKRHEPGKMNATEKAYSMMLEEEVQKGEILKYRFESVTLQLADSCTLKPDFYVLNRDGEVEFHEVKACTKDGRFLCEDDALVKIKVAAQQYPEFRFIMCGKLPKSVGGWKYREFERTENG